MKITNKIISLLCLLALLLSMAACTAPTSPSQPTETTQPTQATQNTEATDATIPVYPEVENPITFLTLSMGPNYENIKSINLYLDESGKAHLEYIGSEKKVGTFDANVFHGITAAVNDSALPALNGQDSYGEGEANASMFIEFADGSMLAVGYSGEIPEAFTNGYAAVEAAVKVLADTLPEYVPTPLVYGEVDEDLLQEAMAILNGSGIEQLDAYTISQIPKDEYFAYAVGLSSDASADRAVTCAPMMMTTPYSLVIVSLAEGADAEAVAQDFENTIDWRKWVCVAPSDGLIAQKGNLVLCLLASGELFRQNTTGIEAAGWTTVTTLTNPDLQ